MTNGKAIAEGGSMTITWRRTEITRDLLRCDLCGEQADALHFLSDGHYPDVRDAEASEGVQVAFSCPLHDAGGYWVSLDRWYGPEREMDWHSHIGGKLWGLAALCALGDREHALLREAAAADQRAT